MTLAETIALFSEKYERLRTSSLIAHIKERGNKLSYNFEDGEAGDEDTTAPLEFIEAFTLNIRYFIQDSEPISIRNMSKLYELYCTDLELKDKFHEMRDAINDNLNRKWLFKHNNQEITYGYLFQGILYTQLAHSTDTRHPIVKDIFNHPFTKHLATHYFLNCIIMLFKNIRYIDCINRAAFDGKENGT